jgi:phosphoenolpyruvate carboxylase
VRRLKRRLTFKGVDVLIAELEQKLYNNIFIPNQRTDLSREEILEAGSRSGRSSSISITVFSCTMVDNLIGKVMIFGLHFATLDIRQE